MPKRVYKSTAKKNIVEEPITAYEKSVIKIFKSFEEQAEYQLQQMAKRTKLELMDKLEELRIHFLKEHLLPNGKWKPIEKKITIMPPFK